MNTFIEKGLRWLVLAGIFALPFIVLVVAQSLFFPFITGKNFLFRVIVEMIGAAWLGLALVNPIYRPRRSWLLAAFAAFLIIIAIADLQGLQVMKSFWSNFERMEGWVTLAHLFVLFVVTSSMLTTEKLWRRFWFTSIVVSVLVGLYGLLQLFGVLTINQGGVRLDATFGNATYLAAYMMFHLFITAMIWTHLWVEGDRRRLYTAIAVPIMALQAIVLFFTATRGAILGTILGIILTSLILVVLARNSRNVWRVSAGVLGGLVLLSGIFFFIRGADWVQKIEPLQRIASISLTETTTQARFLNWSMAIKGIEERPFLGWGQENFNLVFNKYYDPQMYAQEQWFDRVHNIFFDWLIAGGVLGLLAYLALFGTALVMLWRSGAFNVAERAILTGLLGAYLFHNLFVFDNITSYLYFIFILAYIGSRVTAASTARPLVSLSLPEKALPITGILGIALGIVLVFAVNGSAYAANKALLQAVAAQPTLDDNLNYFNKALSYHTYGDQEVREQLVQGTLSLAGSTQVPDDMKAKLFAAAKQGMLDQIAVSPNDARFPFFLGALLGTYGDLTGAEESLKKAESLSPNKQSIRYQLGLVLLNEEKNDEALAVFKETYELLPSNTDAEIFYAVAAIRVKNATLADSLVADLRSKGLATDSRIIGSYALNGEYSKIADIWAAELTKDPTSLQAQFGLAAAYFAGGDKAKAIAQLQAIEKSATDPDVKAEATSLIKQIQDGTLKLQ